ncbi:MAG: hypothetical protein LH619_06095 [Chitinophagaceae bacterium]|nr:hypothetical protein [Chitinophagaceae bacterium]
MLSLIHVVGLGKHRPRRFVFCGTPAMSESRWEIIQQMDCCQMVYVIPVSAYTSNASSLIVPLTDEHIPQMLELSALTKPGLFLRKLFYSATLLIFLFHLLPYKVANDCRN